MLDGDSGASAGIKDKINPMKLSDKDFENLSEEQLSELRGDNYSPG